MSLARGMKSAGSGLATGVPIALAALQVLMAQGEMQMLETLPQCAGVVIALLLLAGAAIGTWIPARHGTTTGRTSDETTANLRSAWDHRHVRPQRVHPLGQVRSRASERV